MKWSGLSLYQSNGCGSHPGQIAMNMIEQAAKILPDGEEVSCPRW
jgi:hypothetical protein